MFSYLVIIGTNVIRGGQRMNKTVILFMLSCMLVLTACGNANEKNNADTGTNQTENNNGTDSAGNSSKEEQSPD